MKPWMPQKQIDLIQSYLNPTDTMLEYGAGGSTIHFSTYVKKYVSIEHDANWVSALKNKKLADNIELHHCGTNNPIHLPVWVGNVEDFKNYIHYVDTLPYAHYDKVLIDGRVRVECGKKVLDYISSDSLVFVHDFFERERYHSLYDYYELIEKDDLNKPSLAVFKKL
jgi:hypothetical protein